MQIMNSLALIQKYYKVGTKAYDLLVPHSQAVTQKALEVARRVPNLHPDLQFIAEASMLHDIGILYTNAPDLGCFGDIPYICHGYLGRELMEREGFPRHALVCERHVGTGISIRDITDQNLPFPKREMMPMSIEEEIICFADKFFSKKDNSLLHEKNIEDIREELAKFGLEKITRFDALFAKFGF